jgi:catechol 2,3-dioxygenase-like lactoylglutathione lyase family enzyme
MTLIEFFVSDMARSIRYYEALGLHVREHRGEWVQMARDDSLLVLHDDAHVAAGPHYFTEHIGQRPRGTGVEVVFEVLDVDAAYADAQAGGIQIVKPLQDRPWHARDFRIADPDGYFVRFTSPLLADHLDRPPEDSKQ